MLMENSQNNPACYTLFCFHPNKREKNKDIYCLIMNTRNFSKLEWKDVFWNNPQTPTKMIGLTFDSLIVLIWR